jgi:hypothetical protein
MIENQIDVLLTVDRSLPKQQNLRKAGIGIVMIKGRRNRIQEIDPLIAKIQSAVQRVRPGELIEIDS